MRRMGYVLLTLGTLSWAAPQLAKANESSTCLLDSVRSSLDLPRPSNRIPVARIHEQGDNPTCMTCSSVAGLENLILAKTGNNIPLSVPYALVQGARIKLEQAYLELGKRFPGYAEVRIVDQDFIMRAANRYGIVPESAWAPKVPTDKWDDRIFNLDLNADVLLKSIKNGKALSYESVKEIFERKLFERAGPLPESFEYNGKIYTPKSFRDEMLPQMHSGQVQIKGREALNKGKAAFSEKPAQTMELEEALELMARQVDKGIPVPAVVSYNGLFRKDDTMRVDGPVWHFKFYRDFRHGLDMIGYERDSNGKIEYLVMQESKGEERGKNGIIRLHRSYFEPFLRRFQKIELAEPPH